MTHRVYYIGVRWGDEPDGTGPVEKALDGLGDWLRFNSYTWFLSTEYSARELYETLERGLLRNEMVLVIALDPKDRFGLAPPWIWEWIDGQRREPPVSAASILARGQSGIGGGIGRDVAGGIGRP
jgi:hypothetical protein